MGHESVGDAGQVRLEKVKRIVSQTRTLHHHGGFHRVRQGRSPDLDIAASSDAACCWLAFMHASAKQGFR